MIANNAQKAAKAICNLEFHGYHCNYVIISLASQVFVLCNKQKPLQAIITFGEIHTLLKEYRRTRKGMMDKRNRSG